MATDFGFAPYTGAEKFIFISYKSEETAIAAEYARFLAENDVNVYYDAALEPGDHWAKKLLDTIALPNCAGVVFIASTRAVRSQPVIDEVRKAHYTHGKSVLSVYIENIPEIEEPMKTYLESTHSIFAWQVGFDAAKQQLLSGVIKMLTGEKSAPPTNAELNQSWSAAQMFLNNALRSRKQSDVDKAREQFVRMTQTFPADYRGWLGLALCECAMPVSDIDEAAARLAAASDSYSYVVAAGCDSTASPMYTQWKTRLWEEVLRMLQDALRKCDDAQEIQRLIESAEELGHHTGHTMPYIERAIGEFIFKAGGFAEKLNAQFIWEDMNNGEVCLKKYVGMGGVCNIPATINGLKVTVIGQRAFAGSRTVKVVIPQGVEHIGAEAFAGCAGLRDIFIAQSVKVIADDAFRDCPILVMHGYGGLLSRVRLYAARHSIRFEVVK